MDNIKISRILRERTKNNMVLCNVNKLFSCVKLSFIKVNFSQC